MITRRYIFIRDCIAIVAVMLPLAATAFQAQILASHAICPTSNPQSCPSLQAGTAPCPASTGEQGTKLLRWAVAMHRAAANAAGAAVRAVGPAAVPPTDGAERRSSGCN